MFARERQSDRAPQGSGFTIRSWPLRASHLGGAGQELLRSRVCNFEQTGKAGAGNCRTDGRVAQSAERVCEQHETMVRNHSPAANLARVLSLNRSGRFKSTIFRYFRPSRASGLAK